MSEAEIRRRYSRLPIPARTLNHPAAHVIELLGYIDELRTTNTALRATLDQVITGRLAERDTNRQRVRHTWQLEKQLSTIRRHLSQCAISEYGTYIPANTIAAIAETLGYEVAASANEESAL